MLVMSFNLSMGVSAPFFMEKTLYAVNKGGQLMFDVGYGTLIDGVRPLDVDGLRYIRQSINREETKQNIKIIESQLIFTDVRET